MTFDRERLLELARDPDKSTSDIAESFGITAAQLYYELSKDKPLKEDYAAARRESSSNGNGDGRSRKPGAHAASKKKATASAPPPPQWQCQGRYRHVAP